MKKILLVFIIGLIFQSCKTSKKDTFLTDIAIKDRDQNLIIAIDIKQDNKLYKACVTNTNLYELVFMKHFSNTYSSFETFLIKILSKELIIYNSLYQYAIFKKINNQSKIFQEFQQEGLEKIIQKYFRKESKKLIAINSLSEEDLNALIYITIVR